MSRFIGRASIVLGLVVPVLALAQPPAHPAGAPGQGELPPVSQEDFNNAMNGGPQGTLRVRAVQGTKGAGEPGVCEVELVLYHNNKPVWQTTGKLDEHGVGELKNIPVLMAVRPVVRVKYSGVLYQDVGPSMDAEHREASVDVTVYQTTEEVPAWKVAMRHLAASRADGAMNVSETVVVENTGDKTWMGGAADARGQRTTIVLSLPEGADNVHLDSGFHGWCCTAVQARELHIQMPLMPGKATYKFGYRVPVTGGRVSVCVGAAAPIDNAMFLVPDDGTQAEARGVESGGADAIGPARVRMFKGTAVPANTEAGIVLTGLVGTTELAATRDTTSNTKTLTAVIAGGLLGVGLLVVVLRNRAARKSAF